VIEPRVPAQAEEIVAAPVEEIVAAPVAPAQTEPTEPPELFDLWQRVRGALYALPGRFGTPLSIQGVLIPDLHTLSSALGATIEAQVVDALNGVRPLWDPDGRWTGYEFVRQPQRFPDVVLRATSPGTEPPILMGIELKGWYALAKEKEPSFRYKVTPAVPSPFDLLCVMPWALDNVIAGTPQLFTPHVVGARFAAEYRNWWWLTQRVARGDPGIRFSAVTTPYPTRGDAISDQAAADDGGNFGRYSRSGLMDTYIATLFGETLLRGVPLGQWQGFLSRF
jgi:hypothetical protein